MNNRHHPVMLRYVNTHLYNFPLVLIVGREPNNDPDSESTDEPGGLPFNEEGPDKKSKEYYNFKRCAFWNTAFGKFAKANGTHTQQIKKDFEDREACPIIFTDASPIGIRNEKVNKWREREKIGELKFKEQIEKIFKQKDLLSRVKLVIFSGLDRTVYDDFKETFEIYKKDHGYDFKINKNVPFFYGNNSGYIDTAIENDQEIFKEIYNEFINLPVKK